MAGFADAVSHPAFMWLTQAHTSRRTSDEIRIAVLLCAAQMLTTGTTAAIDHFPGQRFSVEDMDAVLAAWAETGMRVGLAMRFFDGEFGDILPSGIPLSDDIVGRAQAVEILKPHPLADLREVMPENCRHSIPVIAAAKERGVDLTAETCPHYLFLSTADEPSMGPNALRVIPPVREPGHAEPLWQALVSGLIDILATDHAPHLAEEKHRPSVWDCAPGFPGVETSMRLMLAEVNRGRLTLSDYARMACEAPARAFGLYPRKGALLPGADADLVLVDQTRREIIHKERLHSIGRESPFDGVETIGLPVMTIVRGEIVAVDGAIQSAPGRGRHVTHRRFSGGGEIQASPR